MKTIYLFIGLMMLVELSGCTQRPVIESNRQNTQPLLTQMLCPMCDVPSLTPPVAKAPPAIQPTESKTISTIDNPAPASETPASSETVATAPTDAAPQETPAQPAPVTAPPSGPSKKVITLDLNAPDLGIH